MKKLTKSPNRIEHTVVAYVCNCTTTFVQCAPCSYCTGCNCDFNLINSNAIFNLTSYSQTSSVGNTVTNTSANYKK